jgi:hypothetical protein
MTGSSYNRDTIDSFMERIDEKLDAISKQVATTNGRVKRLELWKSFIGGGLAMVSLVILPLMFMYINHKL